MNNLIFISFLKALNFREFSKNKITSRQKTRRHTRLESENAKADGEPSTPHAKTKDRPARDQPSEKTKSDGNKHKLKTRIESRSSAQNVPRARYHTFEMAILRVAEARISGKCRRPAADFSIQKLDVSDTETQAVS